jgi:ADP-ribose pyrophosphatase YjhB (NUDIX family)
MKDNEQSVLIGIPKRTRRWRADWLYSKIKHIGPEIFEEWRLPSCYLREGEHPEDAVRRIVREQLGIRRFKISLNPKICSYYSRSDWYPGEKHWDLVFVYRVRFTQSNAPTKRSMKWWRELHFYRKGRELRSKNFGWNVDLMQDLKLT